MLNIEDRKSINCIDGKTRPCKMSTINAMQRLGLVDEDFNSLKTTEYMAECILNFVEQKSIDLQKLKENKVKIDPDTRIRKRLLKAIDLNESMSMTQIIRKIGNTDKETMDALRRVLDYLVKVKILKLDLIHGKYGRPCRVYTRIS